MTKKSEAENLKATLQSLDETLELSEKLCKMAKSHLIKKQSLRGLQPFKGTSSVEPSLSQGSREPSS